MNNNRILPLLTWSNLPDSINSFLTRDPVK